MKALAAAVTLVVAAFFAVGFGLAILFELQGFGRERDTDPRLWYLASLVLGLAACVAVPIWLSLRSRR